MNRAPVSPTPGELAYIEDCRRQPAYHDGAKRKAWRELPAYARNSWELNPTPRDYRAKDYAP
jgi:hypothetical protein